MQGFIFTNNCDHTEGIAFTHYVGVSILPLVLILNHAKNNLISMFIKICGISVYP